ncbi:hypothetical protein SDC9_205592 [bioreactor metagenome]|uniref:Uncharacterized protein n=1 Tax=bioreactor metagenome TaxID=1076179 RepID=A0A645J378_9ZZZZ
MRLVPVLVQCLGYAARQSGHLRFLLRSPETAAVLRVFQEALHLPDAVRGGGLRPYHV